MVHTHDAPQVRRCISSKRPRVHAEQGPGHAEQGPGQDLEATSASTPTFSDAVHAEQGPRACGLSSYEYLKQFCSSGPAF